MWLAIVIAILCICAIAANWFLGCAAEMLQPEDSE